MTTAPVPPGPANPASASIPPPAERVRWFNRLGTRLGFLFTVLLVGSHWGSPYLSKGVQSLLGWIPADEVGIPGPPGFVPEQDLANSTVDEEGNLVPSAEDILNISDQTKGRGEAIVFLDLEDRVIAQSDNIPDRVGTTWDHGDSPWATVEIAPGQSVRTVRTELELNEAHVGWLVEIVVDEQRHESIFHRVAPGDPPPDKAECYFHPKEEDHFADPERLERIVARESLLSRTMYGLLVASSVALLTMAFSRLMTRRLRRLSDQATSEPDPGESLPGPFPEARHKDEITVLARSMNTMRGRVGELLSTLETRDRERREWIAQVSHDLRTPLTALIACLDRLKRTQAEVLDHPELAVLLQTAELDAGRVMALADDLLEIARLDAGAETIREPIPPTELVRRTLRVLEPLCAEQSMELTSELGPDLPLIYGDGRLLTRALENLVVNACQHGDSRVEVRTRAAADGIELCVLDDGAGFPGSEPGEPVALNDIQRTRTRADSSGLGLVVTQRVAQAMGGHLRASNRNSGGACVCLSLPSNAPADETR